MCEMKPMTEPPVFTRATPWQWGCPAEESPGHPPGAMVDVVITLPYAIRKVALVVMAEAAVASSTVQQFGNTPNSSTRHQKNFREMLKPRCQLVPTGPPRAIWPMVVANESDTLS